MLETENKSPPTIKPPRLSDAYPGLPLLGHALEVKKNPLAFCLKAQSHFPEICTAHLGPMNVHLVFHPNLVQEVLQRKSASFDKDTFITDSLKTVLGKGLLTNDGDDWLKQRKMAQPVFHFQRMRDHEEEIFKGVAETTKDWNGDLNLSEELMKLTLKVISEMTLGEDLGHYAEEVDREFPFLVETVYQRAVGVFNLPLWLPTPRSSRFHRIVANLDRIIFSLIKKRRGENLSGRNDLLSKLLQIQDSENGQGLSEKQIRDEVMTIFLAGHETTANSLMWIFYLIISHPEWESKILAEAATGTAEPLVLRAVIEEAMRLYPAGWSVVRRAENDVVIGNYQIRAGELLTIFSFATHRHPEFWKDPETFDPQRFLDPKAIEERHKFAYFPFGGGPRVCIGKHLALFMIERIVTKILQSKKLSLIDAAPPIPLAVTTLGMKDPLHVRVEAR